MAVSTETGPLPALWPSSAVPGAYRACIHQNVRPECHGRVGCRVQAGRGLHANHTQTFDSLRCARAAEGVGPNSSTEEESVSNSKAWVDLLGQRSVREASCKSTSLTPAWTSRAAEQTLSAEVPVSATSEEGSRQEDRVLGGGGTGSLREPVPSGTDRVAFHCCCSSATNFGGVKRHPSITCLFWRTEVQYGPQASTECGQGRGPSGTCRVVPSADSSLTLL